MIAYEKLKHIRLKYWRKRRDKCGKTKWDRLSVKQGKTESERNGKGERERKKI